MEFRRPICALLAAGSGDIPSSIEDLLREHALEVDLTWVSDSAALREALSDPKWDILLIDPSFPETSGIPATELAQQVAPQLPSLKIAEKHCSSPIDKGRLGSKESSNVLESIHLVASIKRLIREQRLRARAEKTQAELITAEGRLKAITSATLDGIVMVDQDGIVSFWNQAAERIFGYSATEVVGFNLLSLVVPRRSHVEVKKAFSKFKGSGKALGIGRVLQLVATHKNGTEFPIEFSLAALIEDGVWHAVGVVRDVTERNEQERKQFEHIQFLRTLIDTLPNPLFYENMEGRIIGCNKAFLDFLNLDAIEVVGSTTMDLLSKAIDDGKEDLQPSFLRYPDACETTFHLNESTGRVRHAVYRKAPYWDADGTPAGYVATIQEITELKETEEALRQNEWLFSAIHSHVVDLIAIIDAEGNRVYTSPSYQFVLGFSPQEMDQLTSLDILHPNDVERVREALNSIVEGGPTLSLEYRLRHKDGRWLYFESKAAVIPSPDPGAVRALVVARDITARKEAEKNRSVMEIQLRQAQKLEAIGQLAAGIAHEINTPTQFIGDNTSFLRDSSRDTFSIIDRLATHLVHIAAISGEGSAEAYAALAELEQSDLGYLREEVPKAIQQSLDGAGRIAKIVKAMKDFSHPGGETKTLTNLHEAIESTIVVSRNEWKYAANLETDFDPHMPLVPCFPSELNQVILNLIVNAAHAIESAKGDENKVTLGLIQIKTVATEEEVQILISDNGTGISEAVQGRMFEPFYTTKPVGKGTGQGLSIAHAVIVDKHQGRIDVQSQEGQGTTFVLHLPLNNSEAE